MPGLHLVRSPPPSTHCTHPHPLALPASRPRQPLHALTHPPLVAALRRYGAVVRGDQSNIFIGGCSSIGDRTVVQSSSVNPTGFSARTYIGDWVGIGQNCVLRACTVDNFSKVGDGCVIQEGSLVEENAILEAGSVLPSGARVPSGEVYGGNPAAFVRKLSKEEIAEFEVSADAIVALAAKHADEFLDYSDAYQLREEMQRMQQKEGPK